MAIKLGLPGRDYFICARVWIHEFRIRLSWDPHFLQQFCVIGTVWVLALFQGGGVTRASEGLRKMISYLRWCFGAGIAAIPLIFVQELSAGPKSRIVKENPALESANSNNSYRDAIASKRTDLDSAMVRKLYMDGEFDPAIDILEKGLKESISYSHNDTVFIFKHLGVMYAAKYETREKGKYYMHQLLMVEPTARIMDMYASDMIYMIFKNIQDEFESNRMRLAKAEDLVKGNSQTEPISKDSDRQKSNAAGSNGQTGLWVGVTAAVVAAGVIGAYFVLGDEPKISSNDHGF
jgi:hypothetical protein